MPLNISKHKSYHVYNAENKERVRKDEVRKEQEDQKRRDQVKAAESDRRMDLLRSNGRKRNLELQQIPQDIHSNSAGKLANPTIEPVLPNRKTELGKDTSWGLDSGNHKPWYMVDTQTTNKRIKEDTESFEAKKAKEDPLTLVRDHFKSSRGGNNLNVSSRKHDNLKETPPNNADIMTKLRKEQSKRERDERERKAKLLQLATKRHV